MSIMSIQVWWSWCLVFATTPVTSHIGDLDAGVTADRAPLGSGRSLVSNFPRQGAVAAVAAQVSSVPAFGAEPCWRLEQKTQLVSLVFTSTGEIFSLLCHFSIFFSIYEHSWSSCDSCVQPAAKQDLLSAPFILNTCSDKYLLWNFLLMPWNMLAQSYKSCNEWPMDRNWELIDNQFIVKVIFYVRKVAENAVFRHSNMEISCFPLFYITLNLLSLGFILTQRDI